VTTEVGNVPHNGSSVVPARSILVLAAVLALAVVASPGASGADASRAEAETKTDAAQTPAASARAFAIRVSVPGGAGAVTGSVSAPGNQVTFGGGFAYPANGSAVTSGALTGSATTATGDAEATANAAAEVNGLSLFGGEITAAQVVARARATAQSGQGSGDVGGSRVSGLVVLGQPVEAAPGQQIPLADWGYAVVLAQSSATGENGWRSFVSALEVHVSTEHGGLPAGSTIQVGFAEAAATAAALPPPPAPPPPTTQATPTTPRPTPSRPTTTTPLARPPTAASARQRRAALVRPIPSDLEVTIRQGGCVFPVHGPHSFTNTFGAPRAVVGWHHGEDIFAPMGAPILAVTGGTVFSVGWNDIGGNRLWLRDAEGNEFYYAHLSAFSPLAVDGTQVRAGDVLGFVGNSGDAQTTPPHLHFEVHPVGLLSLGYDGVVDPNPFLLGCRIVEDVRLVAGATWTPPVAPQSRAPRPGAFLLSSTDISTASARPGSLGEALAAQAPPPVATGAGG
jgi:murein DD-endopeptidase MepM/ murein hydrolase activator NlpD